MYELIKRLFVFSDRHNCIDLVYLVYLMLLRVSADQPSRGRAWIHKNTVGERPLLTNSKCKGVIN